MITHKISKLCSFYLNLFFKCGGLKGGLVSILDVRAAVVFIFITTEKVVPSWVVDWHGLWWMPEVCDYQEVPGAEEVVIVLGRFNELRRSKLHLSLELLSIKYKRMLSQNASEHHNILGRFFFICYTQRPFVSDQLTHFFSQLFSSWLRLLGTDPASFQRIICSQSLCLSSPMRRDNQIISRCGKVHFTGVPCFSKPSVSSVGSLFLWL